MPNDRKKYVVRRPHRKVSSSSAHPERIMYPKKRLLLIRGLPGSGKSYLARELQKGFLDMAVTYTTDDFYMVGDSYVFDRSKLFEAHKWNQDRTEKAMVDEVPVIMVPNTFCTLREAHAYVEMAQRHGYSVEFFEPRTAWKFDAEQLTLRNAHGVPREVIDQMIANWESDYTVERVLSAGGCVTDSIVNRYDKPKNFRDVWSRLRWFCLGCAVVVLLAWVFSNGSRNSIYAPSASTEAQQALLKRELRARSPGLP